MLASSSSDDEVNENAQQQSSSAISSSGPLGSSSRNARGTGSRGSYSAAPGQIIRKAPSQQTSQQPNGSRYPRSPRQVFSSTSSRSSIRSNDTFDGINARSRLVGHITHINMHYFCKYWYSETYYLSDHAKYINQQDIRIHLSENCGKWAITGV